MKVFISWSGQRSHKTAKLLDRWIQCVIQAVDPWLSSRDIDRGSLWFSEISNQLANTENGIVCLTKSNKDKPWILFESGALAKGLSSNKVFTFLIDLKPRDVKDPLAQFNHTTPDKDSMYMLLRSINNGLEENGLKDEILSDVFETYWPQFDKEFKQIIKDTPEEEIKDEIPKDELLSEVLYSVRGIDRRIRHLESQQNNHTSDQQRDNRIPASIARKRIQMYMHKGLSDSDIYDRLKEDVPENWLKDKIESYREEFETKLNK
ncbi:TIR domain-containing protein [Tenacibaculum finnmarkense]|uniref:TIR domain-containing protein n=1 Tax=Tenacibaculum finnmarkense TaxID=2781243 RepID=UPI001E44623B|nr:TIR domain-containing protein [Tenacibaculum finnmarkense]MCD8448018.1 toll/interleukin-1 receptor domain-containing protein [Tenacibaculum finnmarkense genomovar finnmarkense]